jgi:hypothetical protein
MLLSAVLSTGGEEMKQVVWLFIALAASSSARADIVSDAARAAAYLNACPLLQPGSELVAAAKEIQILGKDAAARFFDETKKEEWFDGIGGQPQRSVCFNAFHEYGPLGERQKNFLARNDQAKSTLRRLAATGVELPEIKHGYDEVFLAAAYVLKAQKLCKTARVGEPFEEFLANRMITIRQLTEGHLAEGVRSIDNRIEDWIAWRQEVYGEHAAAAFCAAMPEMYGNRGRAKKFFIFFK